MQTGRALGSQLDSDLSEFRTDRVSMQSRNVSPNSNKVKTRLTVIVLARFDQLGVRPLSVRAIRRHEMGIWDEIVVHVGCR